MTHLIDKHIDERIERYKDYRRKSSSSERMSNLQRYIKGEYHKDNESIFISIKKGRLQDTALGKEKLSDKKINATKTQFEIEKLKKEWHI